MAPVADILGTTLLAPGILHTTAELLVSLMLLRGIDRRQFASVWEGQ